MVKIYHKDADAKLYDITEYVSTIQWSGAKTQVARKLTITMLNTPNDKNIKNHNMKLAETLYMYSGDQSTEYFRGFIVDRERSSQTGVLTYTAYDVAYYLTKSSATYNFKNKTAEKITKTVCKDLKVPTGSIMTTKHKQKLIVKNVKIYDIIMKAYTKAKAHTGKQYMVKASLGKIHVVEYGAVTCEYLLDEDTNIYKSSYKESLDKMVNRVKIYDGDGKQVGVVENKTNEKKYGIFQATYTKQKGVSAKPQAKALLTGVEKTATLEARGTHMMKALTGNGIYVKDSASGLTGLFWINADTHKWEKGVHTMTLTLEFKKAMDKK